MLPKAPEAAALPSILLGFWSPLPQLALFQNGSGTGQLPTALSPQAGAGTSLCLKNFFID